MVLDVLADTLGEERRLLDGLDAHEEEEELLAAVPADQVLLADGQLEDVAELAEEHVPRFLAVAVVVGLEPVDVAHDQGHGALFAAALAQGVDLLEDLLEERLGPEQARHGVELDEVELGHGDGHVIGQPAQGLLILAAEALGGQLAAGLFVDDLEDADDPGAVHDGDGEQAPRRGLEQRRIAFAQAPVEGQVGDADVVAEPGRRGGEILGLERGDELGEIRMGQEGVIPDEGLEVAADDLVLLHDVDRDALGLDDVTDLGHDVEEAADVVGAVDPPEDGLDPLALLLRSDVAGLDGEALLDLAEEARVEQALDLLDLGQDVLDLGFLEAERTAQIDRLGFQARALEDAAEGPEESHLPGLGGGGAAEVDVDAGRPFVGGAGDIGLVVAGEEDAGRRPDHGLQGRRPGKGRVDDRDGDVPFGERGQDRFGARSPRGPGRTCWARRANRSASAGRRVNDEDALLEHSPLRVFPGESACVSSFSRPKCHIRTSFPSIEIFGFCGRRDAVVYS